MKSYSYFLFIIVLAVAAYVPLFSESIGASGYSSVKNDATENLRLFFQSNRRHSFTLLQNIGIKSDAKYIPRYEAGQGGVGMGAGVVFPLFFQRFTGEINSQTNLTIGGNVWFEWDIFLWRGLSSGMEIAGMFTLTPNARTLFMAPITAHIKYTFQLFPVEFPVSLGFGVNMSSIEELFRADFILKPKLGASYRLNQNWILGLFTSYWFIVQSYNHSLGEEYSRLGNFIDTTLGFSYVF